MVYLHLNVILRWTKDGADDSSLHTLSNYTLDEVEAIVRDRLVPELYYWHGVIDVVAYTIKISCTLIELRCGKVVAPPIVSC